MFQPDNNPHPDLPSLMSYQDVADFLRVGKTTIYSWTEKRGFPKPFYLGRKAIWYQADVLAWVKENIRTDFKAA